MKRIFSRITFYLVAVCTLFLLSSCKANMITSIDPDGSGLYAQEIGFTVEEMNSLNSMGSETGICDSTQSDMSDMPSNTVMHEEKRGEETWCIFESPFVSLNELKSIYGNTDIVINDISLVDDNFNYDISLDLTGGDFGSALGMINMKWIVEMPGRVSSHNADEADGSTLTWNLTPGNMINIQAESTNGGLPSFSTKYLLIGIVLLCLCILMLLFIALLVFFVVRRNKKDQPLVVKDEIAN